MWARSSRLISAGLRPGSAGALAKCSPTSSAVLPTGSSRVSFAGCTEGGSQRSGGAGEADMVEMLERAGLSASGQVALVDGRTGEAFDRPVTVGYIYM